METRGVAETAVMVGFSGALVRDYAREEGLSIEIVAAMVRSATALLGLNKAAIKRVLVRYLPPETLGYGDYITSTKTAVLGIDIHQTISENLAQLQETVMHELTHAWQEDSGLEYDEPTDKGDRYFLTSRAEYAALVVSSRHCVKGREHLAKVLASTGATAPAGWQTYAPPTQHNYPT